MVSLVLAMGLLVFGMVPLVCATLGVCSSFPGECGGFTGVSSRFSVYAMIL